MLLLVDNYDSFTYILLDYFKQLGEDCLVVKNDTNPASLAHLKVSKLVLSPGPGKPENAGFLMDYIATYASKIPILGICLGHQAIVEYYGGMVKKAIKPMHGKLSLVHKLYDDNLLLRLPIKWSVVRYHSLIISSNEGVPVIVLAETDENEAMIIKHQSELIYGIQYHPEAHLTEYGLKILSNWLELTRHNQLLKDLAFSN